MKTQDGAVDSEKNKLIIAKEYEAFWELANALVGKEIKQHPLRKHETKWDRYTYHILDMITMYRTRYGHDETGYETAWESMKSYLLGRRDKDGLDYMSLLETEHRLGDIGKMMGAMEGE